MLPRIANEKNSVGRVQTVKKLVHLFRACKARFIDNQQPFLSIMGCFISDELALQCMRLNSRFSQFVGSARCRSESDQGVPFASAASRIAVNEVVLPAPATPSRPMICPELSESALQLLVG